MPRSCPGVGRGVGIWFQNLQVDLFSHLYISWQCSIHVMCMNCKYMLWLYKYPLLKGRVWLDSEGQDDIHGKDLNKMVCPTPWIQSRPNCNTLLHSSHREMYCNLNILIPCYFSSPLGSDFHFVSAPSSCVFFLASYLTKIFYICFAS